MSTLSSVPEEEIGVYKHEDGSQNPDTIAMSIVYNLGDALYNELKGEVPAKYVVKARQATNDKFIDYATNLINQQIKSVLDELEGEMAIDDQPLPKRGEVDPDIHVEVTHRVEGRNALRQVQRKAIQKIRSRYE